MARKLAVIIVLGVVGPTAAQDRPPSTHEAAVADLQPYFAGPDEIEEPTYDVSFAIVATVAKYPDALRIAKDASRRLKIRLNLRGLRFDQKLGLSHSRASCAADDDDFPCYRPRGRWDDGEYVSIELGTDRAYDVVVSSGRAGVDPGFKPDILERAQKVYPEARIEKTKVWFGCAH